MRAAVYAGNFDPVTAGHLSVIERAAGLFDRAFVAVAGRLRERLRCRREVAHVEP